MELVLFIWIVIGLVSLAIYLERRAEKHHKDRELVITVTDDPNRVAARERWDWNV